jgi:hypothetical protein
MLKCDPHVSILRAGGTLKGWDLVGSDYVMEGSFSEGINASQVGVDWVSGDWISSHRSSKSTAGGYRAHEPPLPTHWQAVSGLFSHTHFPSAFLL